MSGIDIQHLGRRAARLVVGIQAGHSAFRIASDLEVAAQDVLAALRVLGLPRLKPGAKPAASEEQLRAAAAAGLTAVEAAAQFGVTADALRRRAAALGLRFAPVRVAAPPSPLCTPEAARALAGAGVCMTEAARRLGVHPDTMTHWARQWGVRFRNGNDRPRVAGRFVAAERRAG